MSFDLNILVNGNRCKQYYHQGKTFIEAKNGSEYVIQINNNHWKRILAVGSVDGLNILTGKTANEKDSGYIIGAHSSEKIKGFRFSDDEWAMFKFGYKFNGKTYAQSKENGSEKNCGVIGLRFFYEKEPIYTYNPPIQWNTTPQWLSNPSVTTVVTTTTTTRGATASYALTGAMNHSVNYCCSDLGTETLLGNCSSDSDDGALDWMEVNYSKGPSTPIGSDQMKSSKKRSFAGGQCVTAQYSANNIAVASAGFMPEQPKFDMGTEWGRKEHSKVNTVSFERGCQAQSFDIYYASRESLIAMGVPLFNELQVGLPQSFPNGYAQPPKNWVG